MPEELRIVHRLEEIATRKWAGHWEGDLIKGAFNRSCVGTLGRRWSWNRLPLDWQTVALDSCERPEIVWSAARAVLRVVVSYEVAQDAFWIYRGRLAGSNGMSSIPRASRLNARSGAPGRTGFRPSRLTATGHHPFRDAAEGITHISREVSSVTT